jgi:hypothetical protein
VYVPCFSSWQDVAFGRAESFEWIAVAFILLGVSTFLLLKFRKFPGILLPIFLIVVVLVSSNLGTLRDEFRIRQAKIKIGRNTEEFFDQRFRKPVMILPRDAFVNGKGRRHKSEPVYDLQGYVGQSLGQSVEAIDVLVGHDCDRGLLVRAQHDAMKYEFSSRAERRERQFYLSDRYHEYFIKNRGHVEFPDDDAMRVKIVELDELTRNLKPISVGMNWCRNVSDRYYYCEASGHGLALASGIRF